MTPTSSKPSWSSVTAFACRQKALASATCTLTAKFVTTPTYAPRLRERLKVESTLMKDAENRGWSREIERHQATVTRINQLLTDLGELEDCPGKETKKAGTLK